MIRSDEDKNREVADLLSAYEKFNAANNFVRALDALELAYKADKRAAFDKVVEFRGTLTNYARRGNSWSEECYNLLRRAYILTARDLFDDFMIAMEWNRPAESRFWLPRRKVLEEKLHIATLLQKFISGRDSKLLSMSMPPGTGKTTLIKFLLTYIAGRYPNSSNMYCSYAQGMIDVMFSSLLSMMTDSEYNFCEIFPRLGVPEKSAEYNTISFRNKGDFPTMGLVPIGGSVTGRTRANMFLITDDLVKSDEVARSPERLDTLWHDYTNTLTTRKIGDSVKEIMLGTIWSPYDPISRMKSQYEGRKGYYFVSYPVCDAEGHSNFNYEHPDRYTDDMIKDLKERVDPVTFSCLYMQRGILKGGAAFGADTLKYYTGVLPDGEPDNIFFFADVAWGGGDSFAMPIAYQFGEDVYIHDVIFDKGDKSITKPRVVAKILDNNVRMGRFEANAGGTEYCDDVARVLRENHNYSLNLSTKSAPTTMSKLTRIEQHQDTIRTFYFRAEGHRDRDYTLFMSELNSFSFIAKNSHDDAADSLAGLCEYRFQKKKSVVTVRGRVF